MAQRLTQMEIDRIDLVDKGANGRRFALFKRDDGPDEADERSLIEKIAAGVARALHIPAPVAKATTFAQIVAGREMSQALEEHWYTLQDALWSAIYATDDEGADLSTEAKKALVAQNLDEFKAFVLERMDAGVEKGAGPSEVRLFGAYIAKVGRKVSSARLARLKEAADALAAVLAEVEADDESAKTEKRATPQEEDMTPEELVAAIQKANEPLMERIEALEKAATPAEPVTKSEVEGEDGDVSLATVVEAITKLADRVEAVEKRPGARQSAGGDEAVTKRESGQWAGIL